MAHAVAPESNSSYLVDAGRALVTGERSGNRKRWVVLSAQLSMCFLAVIAVSASVLTHPTVWTAGRMAMIVVATLAYCAWSVQGIQGAARFVLWNRERGEAGPWPVPTRWGAALHLAVQFGLAEVIVALEGVEGAPNLLWLVLLPPVSYAVMFLGPVAVALVTVGSMAAHLWNVGYWHGWSLLHVAAPGFAVALLFTIVFTRIATSAERSRGEVERLVLALESANEKLREQAMHAEELASSRERNRIAREIHDGLGHCLTIVHVQLEAARSMLPIDSTRTAEALQKATAMNQTALQEVRRSVSALSTSPLGDRPLTIALERLVAENQTSGLTLELIVRGRARVVDPQVELGVYRAVQEGLTNCRKHARAARAVVTVDFSEADRVRVSVADDGKSSEEFEEGFGIRGLRERAGLLGGKLSVGRSSFGGFSLELELPCRAE